jgi:hypothetical protein
MTLPKIDVPTYWVTIPSTQKEIKVRPFSVKEEKLLLMAAESKDVHMIVDTVKQVINNCVIEGDAFDMEKLPFFDVDFLFIFLRAKSIGETVELNLTCNNEVDGHKCGNVIPVSLDIANATIKRDESIDKDIRLDKNTGVIMKYPPYSLMKELESTGELDQKTEIITSSIDYIYDTKGSIYRIGPDFTKKEMKDFVESLTEVQYKKLERFVDNFPVFVVKLEEKCGKCGFEHKIDYTDFYDFFFS